MDTLFHYTNAAGLLGILKGHSFWATDYRFLNDAQEAVYARDIFIEEVEAVENPALQPGHPVHDDPAAFAPAFNEFKESLIQELNSPSRPVYVTCFCESGDLLSQWRAYGAGHGYAIEVKADALLGVVQQLAAEPPESASLVQVNSWS